MNKTTAYEALQAVWESGKLSKLTDLEDIQPDGTVTKFNDPLTQKVYDALVNTEHYKDPSSELEKAAVFALNTLQDMAEHGVDGDTFNEGGAGYEAVELLFKATR